MLRSQYAGRMITFTFDVLPLHPAPQPGESLTGYLRRIAHLNSVQSVHELSDQSRIWLNNLIRQPDTPLADYAGMAKLLVCTEDQLRDLTFQHLLDKFGRSGIGQRPGTFLSSSLSYTLRYCPLCLAENTYYRLIWRFTRLAGCPDHAVAFIDRCPGCEAKLPVFSTPFQLDCCPHCETDLRAVEPAPLTRLAHQTAIGNAHELSFLLAPHDWHEAVASALGPQLAALRKQARLTAAEVGAQIGITETQIKGVESRDVDSRQGTRLEHYLDYAAALRTSLRDILLDLAAHATDGDDLTTATRADLYEAALLERAQVAAAELEALGDVVTQAAIGRALSMSVPSLRYYPRLRAFLEQYSDTERLQALRDAREDDLLAQANDAVAELREQGERVTAAAIGRIIGRAPEGFRYYPRLQALIEQESDSRARYEAQLLAQVRAAIAELEAEGELISQARIAQRVGLTPEALKRYDSTARLLDQVARQLEAFYAERGANLLHSVNAAIASLEQRMLPINQEAIAEIVNMTINGLKHYPEVKAVLQSLPDHYREYNQGLQAEARDHEMSAQIVAAAQELHAAGQPVTRASILAHSGIASRTLSRHKGARETLKRVVAQYAGL